MCTIRIPLTQAEALFKQGVELERAGEVFEAMQMYRRAVHLDPQIEFKMYDKTKAAIAAAHDRELAPAEQRHADDAHESDDNIDDLTTEELIARFAKAVQIGDAAHPVDDGVIRDNSVQLLSLPMEILVYILRWVVSSHLDLRSLEQCSMASKSLYLCTRQSEIWRLACQRYALCAASAVSLNLPLMSSFMLNGLSYFSAHTEYGAIRRDRSRLPDTYHGGKCTLSGHVSG